MIRETIIKEGLKAIAGVALDGVIPFLVTSKDLVFLYKEKHDIQKEIKRILIFIGKVAYDTDIPIKKNNKVICNEIKRVDEFKKDLAKVEAKINLTIKSLGNSFKKKREEKKDEDEEN